MRRQIRFEVPSIGLQERLAGCHAIEGLVRPRRLRRVLDRITSQAADAGEARAVLAAGKSLEEFLERVDIRPVRDTFLVELASSSKAPQLSAARVNTLLDVFVSTSNEFVGSRFVAEEVQAREREAQAGRALDLARSRRSDFLTKHGQIPFDARERALTVRSQELEERFARVEIQLASIAAQQSRVQANLAATRPAAHEV